MTTTADQVSVAVCVNVYKEPIRQVTECLTRIAENLPNAIVGVFMNGEYRVEVRQLATRLGFEITYGPNLFSRFTWHLWWLRILRFFVSTKCDVCFKLDPDTMVDRRPNKIPTDLYFGTVQYSSLYNQLLVQGGVTGLSSEAVCRILSEEVLKADPSKPWFNDCLYPSPFPDDHLLAATLRHMDILPCEWSECNSRWRKPVSNSNLRYAMVHPRYY